MVAAGELDSGKLDELFVLLEKATLECDKWTGKVPLHKIKTVEKGAFLALLVSIACLLVLAAWKYLFVTPAWFKSVALVVTITYLITAAVYIGVVGWLMLSALFRIRKNPYAELLFALKCSLHTDATLVADLRTYDKATLEYVLLQYRHCWSSFNGRITTLAGDVRKIGLFPALAALSATVAGLLKFDQYAFLWMPIVLAATFYVIACASIGKRDRSEQIASLLEYVIARVDSKVREK